MKDYFKTDSPAKHTDMSGQEAPRQQSEQSEQSDTE